MTKSEPEPEPAVIVEQVGPVVPGCFFVLVAGALMALLGLRKR